MNIAQAGRAACICPPEGLSMHARLGARGSLLGGQCREAGIKKGHSKPQRAQRPQKRTKAGLAIFGAPLRDLAVMLPSDRSFDHLERLIIIYAYR